MRGFDAAAFFMVMLAVILGHLVFRELEARGILIRPVQDGETLSPTASAQPDTYASRFANPIEEHIARHYPRALGR